MMRYKTAEGYSLLLTNLMFVVAKAKEPEANSIDIAQEAIETTAQWFDEVLDTIGIMPSCIPNLLRWQAHSHEYEFDKSQVSIGDDEMDNEPV